MALGVEHTIIRLARVLLWIVGVRAVVCAWGLYQYLPLQKPTIGQAVPGDRTRNARSEDPPESTFKKLKPAKSRYSLLRHDEL